MADDAAPLLRGAGQEAGHVGEGEERDVEGVAGAHEPRALARRLDVEHSCQVLGLVADHADGKAVEPREAADDVLRPVLVDLEELLVVDDARDHVAHVVGLLRVVGDERVQLGVLAVGIVVGLDPRRHLEVVLRQEADQVADVLEARLLVLGSEVRDAGLRVVGHRAAERLELDLLAGDGLDHLGPGDEHVRGLLHHEDEVGHRGRVDGAARARAHDHRDLRDHARALDVADEDVAVGAERDDALLDPRAARVVQADYRGPDLRGEVHDLHHLLGHHLAERAAEDGEVLAEDEDRPAVDGAVAGDDGVAPRPVLVHLEVVGAVADEGVELLERAGVEELLDPLARGQLALGVLLFDRRLGGRVDRLLAKLAQVVELLFVGLRIRLAHGARESMAGVLQHRCERVHHRGVELGSGELAKRGRLEPAEMSSSQRIAVRDDAREDGDLGSREARRAAAVVVLLRAKEPLANDLRNPGASRQASAGLLVGARRLVDPADVGKARGLAAQLCLDSAEAQARRRSRVRRRRLLPHAQASRGARTRVLRAGARRARG